MLARGCRAKSAATCKPCDGLSSANMTSMKSGVGVEEVLAINTIWFRKLVPDVWKRPIPASKGGAEVIKMIFLFGKRKEYCHGFLNNDLQKQEGRSHAFCKICPPVG